MGLGESFPDRTDLELRLPCISHEKEGLQKPSETLPSPCPLSDLGHRRVLPLSQPWVQVGVGHRGHGFGGRQWFCGRSGPKKGGSDPPTMVTNVLSFVGQPVGLGGWIRQDGRTTVFLSRRLHPSENRHGGREGDIPVSRFDWFPDFAQSRNGHTDHSSRRRGPTTSRIPLHDTR